MDEAKVIGAVIWFSFLAAATLLFAVLFVAILVVAIVVPAALEVARWAQKHWVFFAVWGITTAGVALLTLIEPWVGLDNLLVVEMVVLLAITCRRQRPTHEATVWRLRRPGPPV